MLITEACQSDTIGESEFTSTSAADESCDTVIYLGPSGGCVSDRELTDLEHPPIEKENTKKVKRIDNKNSNNSFCRNNRLYKSNPLKKCEILKNNLSEQPIIVNIESLKEKHSLCIQNDLSKQTSSNIVLEQRKREFFDDCLISYSKPSNLLETDNFNEKNSLAASYRNCASENNSPIKTTNPMVASKSLNDKSIASFSSTVTLENFERQLVAKIAERIALEDEFDASTDQDNKYLDDNNESHVFFIDDDLESVGAKLNNVTSSYNDLYYGEEFGPSVGFYEMYNNSKDYEDIHDTIGQNLYNSEEDTDERTNVIVR